MYLGHRLLQCQQTCTNSWATEGKVAGLKEFCHIFRKILRNCGFSEKCEKREKILDLDYDGLFNKNP